MTTDRGTEQRKRREYLIIRLASENPRMYPGKKPSGAEEQKWILRALMNVRPPAEIDDDFLKVQDEYLKEELRSAGITESSDIPDIRENIALWKGDITRLKVDAIVNAANSGMTGCYQPCHACIDNCIHTYAGIQLRLECARQMMLQGFEEPVGRARITPGYNLPCRFIIHTVGPAITDRVRTEDIEALESCYRSCLETAVKNGVKSIAFCCISTGMFRFPPELAARIATDTVTEFLKNSGEKIRVIFNVFSDRDEAIYRSILCP